VYHLLFIDAGISESLGFWINGRVLRKQQLETGIATSPISFRVVLKLFNPYNYVLLYCSVLLHNNLHKKVTRLTVLNATRFLLNSLKIKAVTNTDNTTARMPHLYGLHWRIDGTTDRQTQDEERPVSMGYTSA
jgi:hypothetical protein